MSAYFTQTGSALARARLAVQQAIGISIVFSHRGGTNYTLAAKVQSSKCELVQEGGVTTEVRVLTLLIATGQTGFVASTNDVEPIIPGDKITYQGRTWFAADPIGKDKFGTQYLVRFVERKRLASGVA